jgi:hypothetical protein
MQGHTQQQLLMAFQHELINEPIPDPLGDGHGDPKFWANDEPPQRCIKGVLRDRPQYRAQGRKHHAPIVGDFL